MRPRPWRFAKTAAGLGVVTIALGGWQADGSRPDGSQLTVISPVGTAEALVEQPVDPPPRSFVGLADRERQATATAADAGADITAAVLDRNSGQLVTNGNDRPIAIASVVKLFIADDLLLKVATGQTTLSSDDRDMLDVMLRSSDDSAAEVFWDRGGGSAIIDRVVSRYGLASTRPPDDGRWFNTISTATDLVRYYDKLLAGTGGLPGEQASVILSNLAASTPTAPDGMVPGGVYPQRFGIPEGLPGDRVAVKQGWMCCVNSDWMHLSTGVIGLDRRYVMAIGSMQPTDAATARRTITAAVRMMFPDGRI
ncbi:serine hydrolase [Mycolicibacterium sp. 018/SC-01/001]|uniref:serine hydrolase n=1 Tax=Mycolicibacterium sp. 018/SC-01/001 TaxID=2592069 RepID=UPI00117F0AB3|nr:serine hydrolase [Mycolicibacterium sp. 018/SC-01/001]TRW80743.1 serine hydrolase [Mycolicibacterium sp. 018/SC-01/001]